MIILLLYVCFQCSSKLKLWQNILKIDDELYAEKYKFYITFARLNFNNDNIDFIE